MELKRKYLQNVKMISDTDTEIVIQLIEQLANSGLTVEEAFRKTLKLLKGSYAVAYRLYVPGLR